MGSPGDAAPRRRRWGGGREDAIETLIDMDPRGAAYRVSRTMDGALASALRGRSNRIPDMALFNAAHALSRYEITLDDPQVVDLYGREEGEKPTAKSVGQASGDQDDEGEDERPATPLALKAGWQDRVLRHHDKIVRARNHNNVSTPSPVDASPGGPAKFTPPGANNNAVPPPALISALRQIFGTTISSDQRNLLSDNEGPDESGNNKNNSINFKPSEANSLPSLLHAVLNHGIFAMASSSLSVNEEGEKSPPPSGRLSIKRDWKCMFTIRAGDGGRVGEEEEGHYSDGEGGTGLHAASRGGSQGISPGGEGEDKTDQGGKAAVVSDTGSGGVKLKFQHEQREVRVPSAANLESIVGSACGDVLHRSGSASARVQGLLIAALSVITECLFGEDDLEKLSLGEVAAADASLPVTSSAGGLASSVAVLDSVNDTTDPFANLLQVGALLSVLPKNKETVEIKEFMLDEKLLRYFVEASSTYEERIEIQKAILVKSQTSLVATSASASALATRSAVAPKVKGILKKGAGTSPNPPGDPSQRPRETEEARASDTEDSAADLVEAPSASSMPDLVTRGRSESVLSSDGGEEFHVAGVGETAASILLGNIASLVNDLENTSLGEDEGDGEDGGEDVDHVEDVGSEEDEEDDGVDSSGEDGGIGEASTLRSVGSGDDDASADDESADSEDNSRETMEEGGDEDRDEMGLGEQGEHEYESGRNDEKVDDNHGHDEEGQGEDEDAELQRALALSLAAAVARAGGGVLSDVSDASRGSDATTGGGEEAATGKVDATGEEDAKKVSSSTSGTGDIVTSLLPAKTGEDETPKQQTAKDNSTSLPPLPTSPPLSLLLKYGQYTKTHNSIEESSFEGAGVKSINAEALGESLSAIFEPSTLSSFGKVPSSHVLVHLLWAVLGMMHGCRDGAVYGKPPSFAACGDMASRCLFETGTEKKLNDGAEDCSDEATGGADFVPDSVTASLLIASLHLLSHLRNSAVAALNYVLSNNVAEDHKDDGGAEDDDDDEGSEASIQIADSFVVAMEDPLPPEKDDPASSVAAAVPAALESLETKGLKRKAAAAAQIATLRHRTRMRLAEVWRGRVSFYSVCCLLNLRCLRAFMGSCLRYDVVVGAATDEPDPNKQPEVAAVSISTKLRLGLLSVLSSFNTSATSASFQVLKVLMERFHDGDAAAVVDDLQDQFFVMLLCNESLYLWGIAIPFLYPDHKARTEFLRSMLLSASAADLGHHSAAGGGMKINSCNWTDRELQDLKLDIFCKRLRVSDMLDYFVALPVVNMAVSDLDQGKESAPAANRRRPHSMPDNSLSMISLLTEVVQRQLTGRGNMSNIAKFHLALCGRAISNLILWNNLSMSSNDVNDHDISGGQGDAGPSSAGPWASGLLQVKVNPLRFHFDPAKCADSISIAASGSQPAVTANQRATKVWGTVLSTMHFPPKTGVHRWAVKLDRCERGHVFVGVSTARANLKTYVGGDSNGWGLIGTQALWHDRNKIRGDYGATFRTGAVVVVTLDTNVGTLSFGLWKDASSSSSEGGVASAGPLSPQALMASPRRLSAPGTAGPVIEDWGIAFEGLPLDVKLYPAVGLYQRDDRATLYTVSNPITASRGKTCIPPISGGDIYFPFSTDHDQFTQGHLSFVRSWNQTLCSDGISFATEMLSRTIQLLSIDTVPQKHEALLMEILPSLAASICLIPSCIPTLSAKYAMELLPHLTRCVKLIDKMIPIEDFGLGVEMKEGAWLIRVDSSSEGDLHSMDHSEGYLVYIRCKKVQGAETGHIYYHGESIGSPGNLNTHFSVIGATCGTRVQFVEEWCSSSSKSPTENSSSSFEDCAQRSTSSFVIDARLSLDGMKFEGIRHNVQKGSAEHITGHLREVHPSNAAVRKLEDALPNNTMKQWIQTESLLCLAVGHLSLILCSQTSLTDIDRDTKSLEVNEKLESLLSSSLILSRGKLDRNGSHVRRAIDSVWERCRSAEVYADIVEQWQDSIYFDLFSATEMSTEDVKIEDARSIIEHQMDVLGDQKGSLSRLLPGEYTVAQTFTASAIFYHMGGLRNEKLSEQTEVATEALQASLQIMESGIREALARADAGFLRKDVCEQRCFLSALIAKFLFEFSCIPEFNRPKQSIADDIARIFRSVKSEQDLNYLTKHMNARTEKSIMHFVGLRSLHMLFQSEDCLEGICVHSAIESALVSLPRLLHPPATTAGTVSELESDRGLIAHLTSSIAGGAASVQTCVHTCIHSLYEKIGSILSTCVDQKSMSLMLGLLANYFTVFHPAEYKESLSRALPTLKSIVTHYRDGALLPVKEDEKPSTDTVLLKIVCKQECQRLLRTSASVLLTLFAQLSRSGGSSSSVELLSEHLLQEIVETVPFLVEDTKMIRDYDDVEALKADWASHRASSGSKPKSQQSHGKLFHSSKGLVYLLDHGSLSMKPVTSAPESSSTIYFGHLLNVLHVALHVNSFLECIKKRARGLLSAFSLQVLDEDQSTFLSGLPLKFRRRILRLLRPILLVMEADTLIIRQLFHIAGSIAGATHRDANDIYSIDDLLLVQSAVSLLRYLHTFSKSWREVIGRSIIEVLEKSNSLPSIFYGLLTFFGGAPGSLHPGAFVVIQPESASSSSTGVTKPRNGGSSTGAISNATHSSTSGAEQIVSGLCRNSALSGVMVSVDPRTGSCEVIVLGNKSHIQLPPSTSNDLCLGPSRMTIRAVRVSSTNVSAADELPLFLDDTNLQAMDIFTPLLNLVKSVSSSIKAIQGKEFTELQLAVNELMTCALGLRSTTILISVPKVLHNFVADKSSSLRLVLANALLLASPRTNIIHGLSSLPSVEARFWHLLSVRLSVKFRVNKLAVSSSSNLKALFEEEKSESSDNSPRPTSSSKVHHAPLSAAASSFFDSERAPRSSVSSEVVTNRREGSTSSSATTAERNEEEDEESSDTAAAHLREAAIVQMAELGLPRQWAELALSRVGGTNIEAAVHFCLERGADMERLLAEEADRRGPSSFLSGRRRGFGASRMGSSNLIRQLVEMGFPRHWCVEALAATRNNVDEALTWILTNGDRLSAEDEAAESGRDGDDNEESEEEEEHENDNDEDEDGSVAENNDLGVEEQPLVHEKSEATDKGLSENVGWAGVCPIRFVSGRSSINPKTLEITGLQNGGFSSVGTKGVLLTSGKWYYEAEIKTAGCLQIGWADSSFVGHCQADRGDGCGDGPSSWAFDGWRRYRWHSTATEWGCRWAEGDIVGCLVDMDVMNVSFTLNGKGEEIGMGVAFSGEGFRPCSGVYACVSFNRREKLRLILGGEAREAFKYPPPNGYRGIGEAIHDAIKERDILLDEEKVLVENPTTRNDESLVAENKRYICDFSDGEHGHELFAWQHRYYGSDASVHLGSSRPSLFGGSGGNLKTLKSSSTRNENSTVADISLRLSNISSKASTVNASKDAKEESFDSSIQLLRDAYLKIDEELDNELKEVCASLCVLYSQKVVMHVMVSHAKRFSLLSFLPALLDTPWAFAEDAELEVSRRLWQVLEHCTSLQSSGWVGEAGAMAVAAEALGLGISAGDNKSNSIPVGMCSVNTNEEVLLLCGGVTQFLSSAILPDVMNENNFTSTSLTFAACSEHAIGSDGGGSLCFIRSSLQGAVASSASFRQVILAAVRRAIRLLAVIEYSSDEGSSEDDESESEHKRSENDEPAEIAPDARLASFLTGLLLSLDEQFSASENVAVRSSLFEGWCVGLLSASSPWRMVCAFTAAGILNMCPQALAHCTSRVPIIAKCLGRLQSIVLRRTWAERAAVPVCSKYSQALMELLTSVKRTLRLCPGNSILSYIKVDAATPLPLTPSYSHEKPAAETAECKFWECSEGWVISNTGWEIWAGTVEIMEVEWTTPPRSIVRTLMDGGEGPPLLRENCTVMRSVDWDAGNDDGKDLYEKDKLEKEQQKRVEEEDERKTAEQLSEQPYETENVAETESVDPASEESPPLNKKEPVETRESEKKAEKPKKKKKKAAASKLPLGTVLSIEPWNGTPAMARRVRWNLTGKEGIYRYGGDGGRFDIIHVETNEKETRVKKKHPPPETIEQCASRYGFGKRRTANVLLRLNNCSLRNGDASETDVSCDGILEWPDFGAGVSVDCTFYPDGAISITEKEVLYGSKDSGWDARFGQPAFVPGTVMVISPTHASTECDGTMSAYDELLGSNSFVVKNLRNKEDGGRLRVTSEMRLLRSKQEPLDIKASPGFSSSQPPPIRFDPNFHASSISLSKDGRSVTCTASDGRGVAFGNVGFMKGVHYWEAKLEKAEIGSVYIGVAEKPGGPSGSSQGGSYSFESQPRLNRWLGWGFVNFRATYTAGAERVYGAHCHAGDTVGVILDCDAGRISYFLDGVKYGEHILNDLGCAFENVSPFGFNADGCGSGGAGQGAPSGIDGGRNGRYPANGAVRPKALWPVIGLRHPGDRVTMSSKWITSHGVDGDAAMRNNLAVDEILCAYERPQFNTMTCKTNLTRKISLPQWFVEESFHEYTRWKSGRWLRSSTRGSGPCNLSTYTLDVDLDTSPFACAAACASIGLPIAFLAGDRVDVKRSAGRILELQEEAIVLGTYQGRLFYRLISQKSEGGSLMEGGGRSWFWDESEAVDGGLELIGEGLGYSVKLPKLNRFDPPHGGLKVVYAGGAVVRSDLEIFDGSKSMGTIPSGTIMQPHEVIERRSNSCGVVRYLIEHESTGRGWISSRIRGGKEEPIVEILPLECETPHRRHFITPGDSAKDWYKEYVQSVESSSAFSARKAFSESFNIGNVQEYGELLASGVIGGMSELKSDSQVASTYGTIVDVLPHSSEGGCSFLDCALALSSSRPCEQEDIEGIRSSIDAVVHEVATESLLHVVNNLPSTKALMARISMLRAFNRRARFALPWLPLRSAQEGSAILGGLSGFGTPLERAGRTWDSKSESLWVQTSSISSRLRKCREILFSSTKMSFLESVVDATTTPTPLSHDEYELPREVRTVRVNRLKARRAMSSDDSTMKKKHSVFSQLQREMRGWSGATLRRGFVAKGHGGQKRAFKVKLVGEGVNDYSGPYREVFTDAMQEVTDLDNSGDSSLGVLQPSANNRACVGKGRDLFVFAEPLSHSNEFIASEKTYGLLSSEERDLLISFSSLTHRRNENSREIEEALTYLGKLVGTACRHGIPVDLPLPLGTVWKRLTEETIDVDNMLKEIDFLASRRVLDNEYHSTPSPLDHVLATQRRLLNSFAEGMSSVLPAELLSIFTGKQLRDIICGNPDIDVELLRKVVEYEGYDERDMVVTFFWEVLREMTTSERKLFLQFVWARNRLPLKEDDFDAPFKILKDTKTFEGGDYPLPSASTCFFTLTLPEYPKKEILKQKLLFAIENVTTMESDYVTNDVEVSEGWRGL